MSSFKKIILAYLILFLYLEVQSQCLLEVIGGTSNISANGQESFGQSFKVCEAGVLTGLALKGFSSAQLKFELYRSASGFTNLLWTTEEYDYCNINGTSYICVDFTAGSGISYTLNNSESVTIKVTNMDPVNNNQLYLQACYNNCYGDGQLVVEPNSGFAFIAPFLDLGFNAAMNGEALIGVCKIGIKKYDTLSDAISEAQVQDTIEILKYFEEYNVTTLPTGVTINNPAGKSFLPFGTFTSHGTIINNGSIDGSYLYPYFINNGTYKGSGTFIGNFVNHGTLNPGQ